MQIKRPNVFIYHLLQGFTKKGTDSDTKISFLCPVWGPVVSGVLTLNRIH